jgi:hypothetical protein
MKRPASLAPLAIVAALVTGAAVGGVAALTDGHAIMPGALHAADPSGDGERHGNVRSHAELDDCEACHPGPFAKDSASDKCLACHDDIAAELGDKASRHGRIDAKGHCLRCHTEHQGVAGKLTHVDRGHFDHEATGFSLHAHKKTKVGAAFRCADCHHGDTDHFAPETCVTCHRADEPGFVSHHVAAWGETCRACHDGVDRFGHNAFDHDHTSFPLTGKHVPARCERCHTKVTTLAGFKQAAAACVSCHQRDDVHKGRLGKACITCHGTDGWKPAIPASKGGFDHQKTAFPLTGAHVTVACADCHWQGRLQGTPRQCALCHTKPRDHFAGACDKCHTTASWEGAKRPAPRPPVSEPTTATDDGDDANPPSGVGSSPAEPAPPPDTTTTASPRRR